MKKWYETWWGITGIVIIGVVVLFIWANTDLKNTPLAFINFESTKTSTKPKKATESEEAVRTITAERISIDYLDNIVRADDLYKGKRFNIQGEIVSIDRDKEGEAFVFIYYDSLEETAISAIFRDENDLINLKKGDEITVSGKIYGKKDVFVIVYDCILVK